MSTAEPVSDTTARPASDDHIQLLLSSIEDGDLIDVSEARGLISRVEELKREIDTLTKSGIVEVAVRNPSVMEYMKHWEGRALKAEAALTALSHVQAPAEPIGYAIQSFATERRKEFEENGMVIYHQPMGMATMPLYASPAPQVDEAMVERAHAEYHKVLGDPNRSDPMRAALEAAIGGSK